MHQHHLDEYSHRFNFHFHNEYQISFYRFWILQEYIYITDAKENCSFWIRGLVIIIKENEFCVSDVTRKMEGQVDAPPQLFQKVKC